jgi:LDH2 family malate/lactate/ureidoglycolate dehydrogenase
LSEEKIPPLIQYEELQRVVGQIFEKVGMPAADAAWTAETLARAELTGTTSHGTIRIPDYVARFEGGAMSTHPQVRIVKDAGAITVLDGDNGMGQVVAKRGMEECISRAEKHNVGVVLMTGSNHFGAAALYAGLACDRGMVGLCTTNTVKVIAPFGGKEKLIGNNPVSIAVPGDPPVLLDMALSAVARGYLIQARRAGKKIPEGWGVDAEGRPTTDPNEALESGSLSPIASHKGSGLSIAIDAVLGALTGRGHSHQIVGIMNTKLPGDVTHFFAALRIEALLPLSDFRGAVDALCTLLRSSPKAAGVERIWMPGEIEYERVQERRKNGIPLLTERVAEISKLTQRFGIHEMELTE